MSFEEYDIVKLFSVNMKNKLLHKTTGLNRRSLQNRLVKQMRSLVHLCRIIAPQNANQISQTNKKKGTRLCFYAYTEFSVTMLFTDTKTAMWRLGADVVPNRH